MTKSLSTILLLLICNQICLATECGDIICVEKSRGEVQDKNRKEIECRLQHQTHICYELGNISIVVADGDSLCDVYISLADKQKLISTTIAKSSLLDWAFKDLPSELICCQWSDDIPYKGFDYKLSYIKDGKDLIISSYSKGVVGNNKLTAKISDLKTFLIQLWIEKEWPKQ